MGPVRGPAHADEADAGQVGGAKVRGGEVVEEAQCDVFVESGRGLFEGCADGFPQVVDVQVDEVVGVRGADVVVDVAELRTEAIEVKGEVANAEGVEVAGSAAGAGEVDDQAAGTLKGAGDVADEVTGTFKGVDETTGTEVKDADAVADAVTGQGEDEVGGIVKIAGEVDGKTAIAGQREDEVTGTAVVEVQDAVQVESAVTIKVEGPDAVRLEVKVEGPVESLVRQDGTGVCAQAHAGLRTDVLGSCLLYTSDAADE